MGDAQINRSINGNCSSNDISVGCKCLFCLLVVFFLHKDVICVICRNRKDPYLILCENAGQFGQDPD